MSNKKKRIKAWVKALRSGRYIQAEGALARTNEGGDVSYCCLGVACVLYNHQAEQPVPVMEKEGSLPLEVAEWYGLERDPIMDGESATTWNDGREVNFAKIATLITDQFLVGDDDA